MKWPLSQVKECGCYRSAQWLLKKITIKGRAATTSPNLASRQPQVQTLTDWRTS
jgi:hypothetical protein